MRDRVLHRTEESFVYDGSELGRWRVEMDGDCGRAGHSEQPLLAVVCRGRRLGRQHQNRRGGSTRRCDEADSVRGACNGTPTDLRELQRRNSRIRKPLASSASVARSTPQPRNQTPRSTMHEGAVLRWPRL